MDENNLLSSSKHWKRSVLKFNNHGKTKMYESHVFSKTASSHVIFLVKACKYSYIVHRRYQGNNALLCSSLVSLAVVN